jgi:hypothetical protein
LTWSASNRWNHGAISQSFRRSQTRAAPVVGEHEAEVEVAVLIGRAGGDAPADEGAERARLPAEEGEHRVEHAPVLGQVLERR